MCAVRHIDSSSQLHSGWIKERKTRRRAFRYATANKEPPIIPQRGYTEQARKVNSLIC